MITPQSLRNILWSLLLRLLRLKNPSHRNPRWHFENLWLWWKPRLNFGFLLTFGYRPFISSRRLILTILVSLLLYNLFKGWTLNRLLSLNTIVAFYWFKFVWVVGRWRHQYFGFCKESREKHRVVAEKSVTRKTRKFSRSSCGPTVDFLAVFLGAIFFPPTSWIWPSKRRVAPSVTIDRDRSQSVLFDPLRLENGLQIKSMPRTFRNQ